MISFGGGKGGTPTSTPGPTGPSGPSGESGPVGPPGLGLDWWEIAGHSLAAAGGARVLPEGGYAFRSGMALGARRIRDYSIGGAVACWPNAFATGDGGYPHILQNVLRPGSAGFAAAGAPYVPKSQAVLVHFGLNDLGELGSQTPLPFQTALRTILSRFAAASIWEDDSPAWTYTGAWSSLGISPVTASSSAASIKFTQTVNDKATFTLPADYPGNLVVAIGLFINSTYGDLTYGLKVDGVSRPDVTMLGTQRLTDQNVANKHIIHTLRIGTGFTGDSVLSPGSHTIELTLKAGPALSIDFAQVEADPADGPIFIMPLPNKPANYSIYNTWPHGPNAASNPINDASVDTWKAAQQAVQNEFPGRVIEIDLDGIGFTKTTDGTGDFAADGAHWNERGHGKVVDLIRSAVQASPLITDRVKARPAVNPQPYWKQVGVHNGAGTFNTNWSNFGGGLAPLMWRKTEDGRVLVRGTIKAAVGATTTVLVAGTLPKPAYHSDFAVAQFDGTSFAERMIRVQSDGALVLAGQVITTAAGNAYFFNFSYDREI